MSKKLCFMACSNLSAEVRAAVPTQQVRVKTFPARCGQRPLAPEELQALLKEHSGEQTLIFGSHCLRAIQAEMLGEHCKIKRLEQCFHLLCNPSLIHSLQQEGSYLLSPGWLARWRQQLHAWGFAEDQALAAEFFHASIKRLVLLDTGTNPKAPQQLQEMAEYLQLPAQGLSLGVEYTALFLEKFIREQQEAQATREREELRQQAASSAMTLDLLSLVTKAKSGPEVYAAIERLFTMLFAPQRIYCLPVSKKGLHAERLAELPIEERQWLEAVHSQGGRRSYQLHPNKQGFVLRVGRGEKTLAWVMVLEVAFPQYLSPYLNTSLHVTEVCALAIEHTKILKKLLDTSWLAGKAGVATEVLHNVGNTLNSISVASERIQEIVEQSCWRTLPDVVHLLEAQEDLGSFFASNPKAQKLPLYFAQLSQRLAEEQQHLLEEVRHQFKQIRRTSEIIRRQQDTAKQSSLIEPIDFPLLIEESIELFEQKISTQHIEVHRDYAPIPLVVSDRHKLFQIIGNLVSNAVDAFDGLDQGEKTIHLRLYASKEDEETIVLEVADNGKGIDQASLEHIFVFGFTTKVEGHGFGLHNAANLTTELGGCLRGSSLGTGQGAVFRMEIPVNHEKK